MELLTRVLSLIGVIGLSVLCFWLIQKFLCKKYRKYPWGHDGTWYYGNKKKRSKKISE